MPAKATASSASWVLTAVTFSTPLSAEMTIGATEESLPSHEMSVPWTVSTIGVFG